MGAFSYHKILDRALTDRANRSKGGPDAAGRGNSRAAGGFTLMMNPAMMTNERKIWEAVLLLVRRHGAAAAEIAHREAQRLRSDDDELTCVVWCWIARSTAELLRPIPGEDERVH
jgi:hypothetical protein